MPKARAQVQVRDTLARCRVFGAAGVVCASAFGFDARADTPPSTWDFVRNPSLRAEWALHEQVDGMTPDGLDDPLNLQAGNEIKLEGARALLEDAGAQMKRDAEMTFDLAHVYEELGNLEARDDLFAKVVELLEPAVADAPDTPAVTEAMMELAEAYAKLDRPEEELAVSQRMIPRLLEDRARITPMMNMGEAQMRLGDLDGAIKTFQDALARCEHLPNSTAVNSTYALLVWDLAVATDRGGDAATALKLATTARRFVVALRRDGANTVHEVSGWDLIVDDPDVYFVPSWEREWYLGLGASSAASEETDPKAGSRQWAEARKHWEAYASQATLSLPPESASLLRQTQLAWIDIARRHVDRAKKEQAQPGLEGPSR